MRFGLDWRRLEEIGGLTIGLLWAYRISPRTTTGEPPFKLAYGADVVIPAEVGIKSHRVLHFDET